MGGTDVAPELGPAALPFDDCYVGQRIDGRPWSVDGASCEPAIVQGALELLLERAFRAPATLLELHCRFPAPAVAGDTLSPSLTVTRCRPHDGASGVVRGHLRLANQRGEAVCEASAAVVVPASGDGPLRPSAQRDFGSRAWGEALRPLLDADPAFREATQTFDGSIELRCADEAVQLRVYRGAVLEVTGSTPLGPTFTLAGSEMAWLELALAERSDFVARASKGQFAVSGNAYEYLRMTKAMVAISDVVRGLAAGWPA